MAYSKTSIIYERRTYSDFFWSLASSKTKKIYKQGGCFSTTICQGDMSSFKSSNSTLGLRWFCLQAKMMLLEAKFQRCSLSSFHQEESRLYQISYFMENYVKTSRRIVWS